GTDQAVDGGDVVYHLVPAVRRAEPTGRCVGRGGVAMAAMVMRVAVETAFCEETGEAFVACGMFGKAVVDLHHGAGRGVREARVEVERRAGRRNDGASRVERHLTLLAALGQQAEVKSRSTGYFGAAAVGCRDPCHAQRINDHALPPVAMPSR